MICSNTSILSPVHQLSAAVKGRTQGWGDAVELLLHSKADKKLEEKPFPGIDLLALSVSAVIILCNWRVRGKHHLCS